MVQTPECALEERVSCVALFNVSILMGGMLETTPSSTEVFELVGYATFALNSISCKLGRHSE